MVIFDLLQANETMFAEEWLERKKDTARMSPHLAFTCRISASFIEASQNSSITHIWVFPEIEVAEIKFFYWFVAIELFNGLNDYNAIGGNEWRTNGCWKQILKMKRGKVETKRELI